jgi:hypothetical protein
VPLEVVRTSSGEKADARTRTGDPFITSLEKVSDEGEQRHHHGSLLVLFERGNSRLQEIESFGLPHAVLAFANSTALDAPRPRRYVSAREAGMPQEIANHHRVCAFLDQFDRVPQLVRMDAAFDSCTLRKPLEFVPNVLAVDGTRGIGNEREERS